MDLAWCSSQKGSLEAWPSARRHISLYLAFPVPAQPVGAGILRTLTPLKAQAHHLSCTQQPKLVWLLSRGPL